jgi:hypothetical protein
LLSVLEPYPSAGEAKTNWSKAPRQRVELPRIRFLLGTRVNRMRRIAPGRARRVSHHTSRSGRSLLTIPPYSTLDGFSKRRRLLTELPLEPGAIYDERFLELVEHLDRLADARVEQT